MKIKQNKLPGELGYIFIKIENYIYNIMMFYGPMYRTGGCKTIASFGTKKDLVDFLAERGLK